MKSIISIHDVSPQTIDKVLKIIDKMPSTCKQCLSLLVIPGLNWSAQQIEVLRQLQQDGFVLAGHGWQHHCTEIRGCYHRLHSLFVSRNAAEHLALSQEAIIELLDKNHAWFSEHQLNPPDFYVPPAWAMGPISHKQLQQSPYRFFESSRGIYDANANKTKHLPLIGFEADTPLRAKILKLWNATNQTLASEKRPLRISIHPHDPELLLHKELWQTLNKVEVALNYDFFA